MIQLLLTLQDPKVEDSSSKTSLRVVTPAASEGPLRSVSVQSNYSSSTPLDTDVRETLFQFDTIVSALEAETRSIEPTPSPCPLNSPPPPPLTPGEAGGVVKSASEPQSQNLSRSPTPSTSDVSIPCEHSTADKAAAKDKSHYTPSELTLVRNKAKVTSLMQQFMSQESPSPPPSNSPSPVLQDTPKSKENVKKIIAQLSLQEDSDIPVLGTPPQSPLDSDLAMIRNSRIISNTIIHLEAGGPGGVKGVETDKRVSRSYRPPSVRRKVVSPFLDHTGKGEGSAKEVEQVSGGEGEEVVAGESGSEGEFETEEVMEGARESVGEPRIPLETESEQVVEVLESSTVKPGEVEGEKDVMEGVKLCEGEIQEPGASGADVAQSNVAEDAKAISLEKTADRAASATSAEREKSVEIAESLGFEVAERLEQNSNKNAMSQPNASSVIYENTSVTASLPGEVIAGASEEKEGSVELFKLDAEQVSHLVTYENLPPAVKQDRQTDTPKQDRQTDTPPPPARPPKHHHHHVMFQEGVGGDEDRTPVMPLVPPRSSPRSSPYRSPPRLPGREHEEKQDLSNGTAPVLPLILDQDKNGEDDHLVSIVLPFRQKPKKDKPREPSRRSLRSNPVSLEDVHVSVEGSTPERRRGHRGSSTSTEYDRSSGVTHVDVELAASENGILFPPEHPLMESHAQYDHLPSMSAYDHLPPLAASLPDYSSTGLGGRKRSNSDISARQVFRTRPSAKARQLSNRTEEFTYSEVCVILC